MAAASTSITPAMASNTAQTAPTKTSAPAVRKHNLQTTWERGRFRLLCVCFMILQLTAAGNRRCALLSRQASSNPLQPLATTPCSRLDQQEPRADLRTERSPLLHKDSVTWRLRSLKVGSLFGGAEINLLCGGAMQNSPTHMRWDVCLAAQSSSSRSGMVIRLC